MRAVPVSRDTVEPSSSASSADDRLGESGPWKPGRDDMLADGSTLDGATGQADAEAETLPVEGRPRSPETSPVANRDSPCWGFLRLQAERGHQLAYRVFRLSLFVKDLLWIEMASAAVTDELSMIARFARSTATIRTVGCPSSALTHGRPSASQSAIRASVRAWSRSRFSRSSSVSSAHLYA